MRVRCWYFAMTADAFADDIVQAKRVGMNAHFAKPLDINLMMKEIRKFEMRGPQRRKEAEHDET